MNLIFDLDGTLIDSLPGIRASLVYALRQQGHTVEDDLDISALIGPPMTTIVGQLLAPYGDDRITQTVDIYRDHYGRSGLYHSRIYEGILSILITLKQHGHSLYIATSKRDHFAKKILGNLKTTDLFSAIIGTPEDGSLDDKAALLSRLIHKNALDRSHSLMVGDRREDIISARRNHLPAIGVLWGYGSRDELTASQADYVCSTPEALIDAISMIIMKKTTA